MKNVNSIENSDTKIAESIVLRPIEDFSIVPNVKYESNDFSEFNLRLILNKPLSKGDIVSFRKENEIIELVVEETDPEGIVISNEDTKIEIIGNIIKNSQISPEHENNVLGSFRKAERELLAQIRLDFNDIRKYKTSFVMDYLASINPLTEIVNELKKFEEEVINLQNIVRTDPNDVLARYNLALRLHALRRDEDAEEEYIRALTLAPDSAVLHASYGNFLASNTSHYSSIYPKMEYKAAIKLDPANIEYRIMLANFYFIWRHQVIN